MRVLAAHGGTGTEVDAYAFSFLVPELLNHFLAAGMLSITFIPLFQKYLVKGDKDRAWKMFSNMMTVGTVFCLVFVAAGMIFAEPVVRMLGGVNIDNPADPGQLELTVRLTRIILPAQIFFFWGALLMGVQYSAKRFVFPSLSGVIYNAGIITGGIVLAPVVGIHGFSWGVLAGALAGNVLLQLYGAVKSGMKFRFRFDLRDRDLWEYAMLTIPLILGLNLSFSNEFLFRFFGSRIPGGQGSIAGLEYSWRIMFMIVGVFGQSLAAGFYPFISQMAVENKFDAIHRLMHSVLVKMAAILGPVSGIAVILSSTIVTALLRTGSFDASSAALTAAPLAIYLAGTYFYAAAPLIYRLFYARGNTVIPLAVNTGGVLACIPLYIYGAQKHGAAGIAFASTFCMVLQFVIIYATYCIMHKNFLWFKTLRDIAAATVISFAAAFFCRAIFPRAAAITSGLNSLVIADITAGLLAAAPPAILAAAALHFLHIVNLHSAFNAAITRIRRLRAYP
jgi:putative peptidoglycan lipid II flippase